MSFFEWLKLLVSKILDRTNVSPQKPPELSPKATTKPLPVDTIKPIGVYTGLYVSCSIRPMYDKQVTAAARKIFTNKAIYQRVSALTNVPWYVIGAIHGLESSWDFRTYLHNGQLLGAKTTIVPKGIFFRKDQWQEAAADALKREGMTDVGIQWNAETILRRCEKYNGMGYSRKGIPSPYVWSMTSVYTKGKYVRDGIFDPNAVSRQVGVAAILKKLEELGEVAIITSGPTLA